MAEHIGAAIPPAHKSRPKYTAQVEMAVRCAQRWIIASGHGPPIPVGFASQTGSFMGWSPFVKRVFKSASARERPTFHVQALTALAMSAQLQSVGIDMSVRHMI